MKLSFHLLPALLANQDSLQESLRLPDNFENGICKGADPSLFDGETLMAVIEAKRICGACPIQNYCLQWALKHEEAGVWGGTTPSERRALSLGSAQTDLVALQDLQTKVAMLQSTAPVSRLAIEFAVTPRTILRWRNQIKRAQAAC